MFIPFNDLSAQARIWIYQADRQISADEQSIASEALTNFCTRWTAHSKALKATFTIFYDRFVVLAVDENAHQASGCSIDSSVHFITQLGNQLNINFLDRSQVAFLIDEKIVTYSLPDIREKITSGKIQADDLVFNNNILVKNELNTSWLVPVKQSWAKKYLKTTQV